MNGSQGAATMESIIPDTGNIVRYVNAGQGAEIIEFTTICISRDFS